MNTISLGLYLLSNRSPVLALASRRLASCFVSEYTFLSSTILSSSCMAAVNRYVWKYAFASNNFESLFGVYAIFVVLKFLFITTLRCGIASSYLLLRHNASPAK